MLASHPGWADGSQPAQVPGAEGEGADEDDLGDDEDEDAEEDETEWRKRAASDGGARKMPRTAASSGPSRAVSASTLPQMPSFPPLFSHLESVPNHGEILLGGSAHETSVYTPRLNTPPPDPLLPFRLFAPIAHTIPSPLPLHQTAGLALGTVLRLYRRCLLAAGRSLTQAWPDDIEHMTAAALSHFPLHAYLNFVRGSMDAQASEARTHLGALEAHLCALEAERQQLVAEFYALAEDTFNAALQPLGAQSQGAPEVDDPEEVTVTDAEASADELPAAGVDAVAPAAKSAAARSRGDSDGDDNDTHAERQDDRLEDSE